jgi:hypothetical protein
VLTRPFRDGPPAQSLQVALQPPMLSLINQLFASACMEVVYAPISLLVDVGSVCSFQALQARLHPGPTMRLPTPVKGSCVSQVETKPFVRTCKGKIA